HRSHRMRGAREDQCVHRSAAAAQVVGDPQVGRKSDAGMAAVLTRRGEAGGQLRRARPHRDVVPQTRQVQPEGGAPAAAAENGDGGAHDAEAEPAPSGYAAQGAGLWFDVERRGGRHDSDVDSGGGTSVGGTSVGSPSSCGSASRATDATRSPPSRPISRTPWVLRPMTLISFTRSRITLPPLVTSMIWSSS